MAVTTTRRNFVRTAALGAGAVAAGMTLGQGKAFAEDESGIVLANTGSSYNVSLCNDQSEKYQAIFDVLVIGAGCAGLAAALEAARAGVKVGLLEAMPNYYEANSSLCGGMIWGWNTPLQLESGLPELTREECLGFLEACGAGHEDPAMSDVIVDEADAQIAWLEEIGVEFPPELLAINGAEYNFADQFEPRPHTHICKQQSGRGFTDAMYNACLEEGVEFVFDAAATNLITDPAGRVVGAVTAKGNFRGNKGVIIASSGYSQNQDLVDGFIPDLAGSCAGSHSVGDGIVMGAALGAKLDNMWCMQAFSVGMALKSGVVLCSKICALGLTGIDVGTDGLRHYDEGMYYEDKYQAVNGLPEHFVWNIWDQSVIELGANGMFCPPCSDACESEIADGVILKADTIEELAEQMGVDAATLADTFNHYNEMASAGVDEDFGRTVNLAPVQTPPFYAAKIIPVTCDSAGGLVVNTAAEVLNWAGDAIPGLYAAGATTAGWRGDVYPGCGLAITNAIVFGRHAAISAAAQEGSAYEGQLADDAGAYAVEEETAVETADNEFVGSAMGMGGDVVVKIAVEDGALASVEVVEQNETEGIGSRAVEELPAAILEAQTYDVDAVGGATVTSDAIKAAVQDAMAQAGLI